MWLKNIYLVISIIVVGESLCKSGISSVVSVGDVEYEQVISDRYLFSGYSNESSWWTVLNDVRSAWSVVSLPEYHIQSWEGVWLLIERNESFEMCYMSIFDNGTLISLREINVNGNGSLLVSSNSRNRMEDYSGALISPEDVKLILCDQSDVRSCRIKNVIPFPSSMIGKTKKIKCGLFVSDMGSMGWLYFGSDGGLHALDLHNFEVIPYVNGINVGVSSLGWSFKYQTIFIGTESKLWIETYRNESRSWRFEHVNALIDSPISSLVYDNVEDRLWIGQSTGITYLCPIRMSTGRVHWYFSRLSGEISSPGSYIGHLPFANITSLSITNSNSSDNCVWLGSVYGLMRYNSKSSENNQWRVFNSGRYMPNRLSQVDISSLAVLNRVKNASMDLGSSVVAITNRGLSVIRFEMWTLRKKSEYFQKYIDDSNRHVRYGLVSDCAMSLWGDPRTCVKGPNDNDGLWTSMYLASQIFRYAMTNDTNVKDNALKHFQALNSLNQVTGILGYPSRSIAKVNEFPPEIDWYPSPLNSTLEFKGDTSSDEIVGHLFVYPLVEDILSSDGEAYSLLMNITDEIVKHNLYLIGENGNHTTWGIWNPNEINNNSFYQESRGLNSLQILSFLVQAYGYTGDEEYFDSLKVLVEVYGYDINLINQKAIAMCDSDFSDDELAYLSYLNFVNGLNRIKRSEKISNEKKIFVENLFEYIQIGLDLSHQYKQMEKSPFYNFIYCYIYDQINSTSSIFDCQSLINDSIWYLQRFPLELINWPQFNSERLDIQINERASSCSSNRIYSLKLLPPDERSIGKWNGSPFNLDDGNGFYEEDPTIFLLSYWGMGFAHFLEL